VETSTPNVETSTDILTIPTVHLTPDRGNRRKNRENIIINRLDLTRLTVDTILQPDKRGSTVLPPSVETTIEVAR